MLTYVMPGWAKTASAAVVIYEKQFVLSDIPDVLFGTEAATAVKVISSTQIQCVTPAAFAEGTTVTVTVTFPRTNVRTLAGQFV